VDNVIYDSLGEFSAGINSGTEPLLLPKNQCAFAVNTTFRDGYATDRPPYIKRALNFGGQTEVQRAVTKGLWQGLTYYKPDSGTERLRAAIGGRLFDFTPDTLDVFQVIERTIPGDPNPASATQAWLWQSELWTIWQDGTSFPVFTDSLSSRRSQSDQKTLGVTAVDFVVPTIGDTVDITLVGPFQGKLGQSVLIEGKTFQVVQPPGTAEVLLTNFTDTPGTVYPVGTQIQIQSNNLGYTTGYVATVPFQTEEAFPFAFTVLLHEPYLGFGTVSMKDSGGIIRTLPVIDRPHAANEIVLVWDGATPGFSFPIGTQVQLTGSSTTTVVATLATPFTVPSLNATALAHVVTDYVGPANQSVFIGTAQYSIKAVPPAPPGTALTLKNVNAHATDTVHAPAELLSIPEIPPGRMGAYGMGRNWVSLTDGRSFIASDIVGGSSGSAQYNYRDAVLQTTENFFLAGGGTFVVPGNVGNITSMTFAATLDASLGQGPLQVGTPTIMFSCNAPVDRLVWQDLTNPILTESLKGQGPLSHYGTINVNSDILFRSQIGYGSQILARREFDTWGNTPISEEVRRVVEKDNRALLGYSSAIQFDNRFLITASPVQGPQGVYWQSLCALNEDPISSLRGKEPSIWDGQWTGLNILQLVEGRFSGVERAFAFCWNSALQEIELYELLPTGSTHFDNLTVPIIWSFEKPVLFHDKDPQKRRYKRLLDGEMSIKDIIGRVDITVQYRSDSDPCWHDWRTFSVCGEKNIPASATQNPDLQSQYRPRLGFAEPDAKNCDPTVNKANREGYWYQLRFVIQGHCRFLSARLMAALIDEPKFAKPACGDELTSSDSDCPACKSLVCTLPDDLNSYTINGGTLYQNGVILEPIDIPPGVFIVPAGVINLYVAPAPVSPLRLQGCSCEIVKSIAGKTPAEIADVARAMVASAAAQYAKCQNTPGPQLFFNTTECVNACPAGQFVNLVDSSQVPANVFLQNGTLCVAAGTFTSIVSAAAAQKAASDFISNLLASLLQSGAAECGYWNTQQIVTCPDESTVTVPAFTTFSTESQEAADAAAVAFGESECASPPASCDNTEVTDVVQADFVIPLVDGQNVTIQVTDTGLFTVNQIYILGGASDLFASGIPTTVCFKFLSVTSAVLGVFQLQATADVPFNPNGATVTAGAILQKNGPDGSLSNPGTTLIENWAEVYQSQFVSCGGPMGDFLATWDGTFSTFIDVGGGEWILTADGLPDGGYCFIDFQQGTLGWANLWSINIGYNDGETNTSFYTGVRHTGDFPAKPGGQAVPYYYIAAGDAQCITDLQCLPVRLNVT